MRYRAALAGLWAAQPAGSQLVVATESARGKGVPSRFEGSPCQSSNLRVEGRGLAAIRALRSVCPDTKQCRVLDLFGATLPHIFDAKVYKLGDPVHFHVHGRLAVPISDHVCQAFQLRVIRFRDKVVCFAFDPGSFAFIPVAGTPISDDRRALA